MIPAPAPGVTGKDVFQETLRFIFFYLVIEKPFDPLQLAILLLAILVGVYLVKKKVAKLLGKVLAIAGIVILVLRVLVVIYLAMQI